MNIRIMIADDHEIVRNGLRSLIEKERDMEVSAEADNGRNAVRIALEVAPDVVIMDIAMPDLNGIEATRQIIAALPRIKVIALSMHADKRYVIEMLKAGASGYILKDNAYEELARAIRTAQIAECLCISVKTAETYRQHIIEKLDIRSIAELTKYAIREGLTSL